MFMILSALSRQAAFALDFGAENALTGGTVVRPIAIEDPEGNFVNPEGGRLESDTVLRLRINARARDAQELRAGRRRPYWHGASTIVHFEIRAQVPVAELGLDSRCG